jgi:uncharacterized membrane protein YdjX (TVP38/TMEM64 family)
MASTRPWWVYALTALAAVVVAVVVYLVWSAYDHEAIMRWFRELHPLPFFIVAALLPAIGVPTSPIYILAGALFGMPLGLVVSWAAVVVSGILCFWIARGLRPLFERMLRMFKTELPDFSERDKGALRFVVGVKLAPGAPAFLKSYALGVSGVPFRLYLVVAMLTTALYATALTVLGESLLDHRARRVVVVVAVLAAVTAAAMWWYRRRRMTADRADAAQART